MKLLSLLFIIIFIVSNPKNSLSQKPSISDTKNWIKEKIEINGYADNGNPSVIYNYYINYDQSGNIIITENLEYYSGSKVNLTTIYTIPIKKLTRISFDVKDGLVWMKLKMNESNGSVKRYSKELEEVTFVNNVTIALSLQIKNNNMLDRLTKAFDDLITGFGGSVNKESY